MNKIKTLGLVHEVSVTSDTIMKYLDKTLFSNKFDISTLCALYEHLDSLNEELKKELLIK